MLTQKEIFGRTANRAPFFVSSFAFDFMAFSETWFTSETNIEELEILGYNMVSDDCTYSSGGGVALCLRDGYDFQMREA